MTDIQHDEDPPLTELQAMSMAYVDDELDETSRQRFEKELASDADLAAEVADHRRLLDLSRATERPEPTDAEMRRFWSRFYNRTEWRLGWSLLLIGVIMLVAVGLYELFVSDLTWLVKGGVASSVIGGCLLLWSTCRQRARWSRLDRYRGVVR